MSVAPPIQASEPTAAPSQTMSSSSPLPSSTTTTTTSIASQPPRASLASKFRGATITDLDLPPALSITPTAPLSSALAMSYDRDYSQLTVIHPSTRSLLGYLSIPHVKSLLKSGAVTETDPVKKAMNRFKRGKGNVYVVITPDTTLEELEEFLNGEQEGGEKTGPREFAVVTDERRRFVLGVATREDLMNFASRRPD